MFSEELLDFFNTHVSNSVMACLLVRLVFITHITNGIWVNLVELGKNIYEAVRDGLVGTLIIGTIVCGNSFFNLLLIGGAFLNAVVYPTQYTRT